jgi:osmotically inducible protein OsmC
LAIPYRFIAFVITDGLMRDLNMNAMQISEESTTADRAKLLYTAKAHTTGGRDGGSSLTSDGRLDVRFSLPSGPDDGTNPEQLFTAAWSGCYRSEIKRVATKMGVELPVSPVIDAEVDLWEGDDGCFLCARINVNLPRIDREIARSMLEGAHQTCPYSKATQGNINTEINLV